MVSVPAETGGIVTRALRRRMLMHLAYLGLSRGLVTGSTAVPSGTSETLRPIRSLCASFVAASLVSPP